jgi:hypothetical protein
MNADYRMLAKGLQFKSLKETNHFCPCQTHLKQEYVKAVKDDIVIIALEKNKKRITTMRRQSFGIVVPVKYGSFIPDFYEQSGKNLMSAYKKYTDEDDADNDQLLTKVKKQIAKFDSDRYHARILKRSTGKLQNNQFVKILNAQPHLFPIRRMVVKWILERWRSLTEPKKTISHSNLLWIILRLHQTLISFSTKFFQIVRVESMHSDLSVI